MNMPKSIKILLSTVLVISPLLLTGCGGGDSTYTAYYDNYYARVGTNPYGWYGAGYYGGRYYDEDDREDFYEHRQAMRQDRQDNKQERLDNRQDMRQDRQGNRQDRRASRPRATGGASMGRPARASRATRAPRAGGVRRR